MLVQIRSRNGPELGAINSFGTTPSQQQTTIEFRQPLNNISRGMVAEEVRHFIDEVELGVTPSNILKAYEIETGKSSLHNSRNVYNWLHRRVFTRMIHDAEYGAHPLMNKLLNKSDVESLHEAYRRGAFGRKDLDWILRQHFTSPHHSPLTVTD